MSDIHPAAWPSVGASPTPAWEWVASIGTVVLLASIFTPNLVLVAMKPLKTARVATYTLVAGMGGAIILLVSVILRAKDYYSMRHVRQAMYIIYWISYLTMILTSVFLISFKYLYAIPAIRKKCRDAKGEEKEVCDRCLETSIAGFVQ